MKKVFYCPACGFIGAAEEAETQSCPRCESNMFSTFMDKDYYMALSEEEKSAALARWQRSAATQSAGKWEEMTVPSASPAAVPARERSGSAVGLPALSLSREQILRYAGMALFFLGCAFGVYAAVLNFREGLDPYRYVTKPRILTMHACGLTALGTLLLGLSKGKLRHTIGVMFAALAAVVFGLLLGGWLTFYILTAGFIYSVAMGTSFLCREKRRLPWILGLALCLLCIGCGFWHHFYYDDRMALLASGVLGLMTLWAQFLRVPGKLRALGILLYLAGLAAGVYLSRDPDDVNVAIIALCAGVSLSLLLLGAAELLRRMDRGGSLSGTQRPPEKEASGFSRGKLLRILGLVLCAAGFVSVLIFERKSILVKLPFGIAFGILAGALLWGYAAVLRLLDGTGSEAGAKRARKLLQWAGGILSAAIILVVLFMRKGIFVSLLCLFSGLLPTTMLFGMAELIRILDERRRDNPAAQDAAQATY